MNLWNWDTVGGTSLGGREGHAGFLDSANRAVFWGGKDLSSPFYNNGKAVQMVNPVEWISGSEISTTGAPTARANFASASLQHGFVVLGGEQLGGSTASGHYVYNFTANPDTGCAASSWCSQGTDYPTAPTDRKNAKGKAGGGSGHKRYALIYGGETYANNIVSETNIYDGKFNMWIKIPALGSSSNSERVGHTNTYINYANQKKWIIWGGKSNTGVQNTGFIIGPP